MYRDPWRMLGMQYQAGSQDIVLLAAEREAKLFRFAVDLINLGITADTL
jgi:hypothetical protein